MATVRKKAANNPPRGQGRLRRAASHTANNPVNNSTRSEINVNINENHSAAIDSTEKHAAEEKMIKSHNLRLAKMVE